MKRSIFIADGGEGESCDELAVGGSRVLFAKAGDGQGPGGVTGASYQPSGLDRGKRAPGTDLKSLHKARDVSGEHG